MPCHNRLQATAVNKPEKSYSLEVKKKKKKSVVGESFKSSNAVLGSFVNCEWTKTSCDFIDKVKACTHLLETCPVCSDDYLENRLPFYIHNHSASKVRFL